MSDVCCKTGIMLKSIYNDTDRYVQSFRAFLRLSDDEGELDKWINDQFPHKIVDGFWKNHKPDKEFRVLGIGSGSGETDLAMLAHIKSGIRYSSLKYSVVEPCLRQISQFQDNVGSSENAALCDGIVFDWRQLTSEAFIAATENDPKKEKYNLIVISHVLYYVSDVKETIRYYHSLLIDGGAMVIMHVSKEGDFCQLWKDFSDLLPHDELCNYYTASDLRKDIDDLKLNYYIDTMHSWLEISSCFEENSSDGSLLLDFVTHTSNFSETAHKSLQENVLAYLKRISRVQGDKLYFNNGHMAVVIKK